MTVPIIPWQDFFMHAIRRDGLGGKEQSNYNGWTAWTATPAVVGDPYSRGSFYPSSYNKWYGIVEGEHPNLREPVDPNSVEGKSRYQAALLFNTQELSIWFDIWYGHCSCWCDTYEPNDDDIPGGA